MAKQGQKFNKYNNDFKNEVTTYAMENGVTKASEKYKINLNTIATWQFQYKRNNNIPKRKKDSSKNKWEKLYELERDKVDFLKKNRSLCKKQINKYELVVLIKEYLVYYKGKLKIKDILEIANLKRSYWNKYKNFKANQEKILREVYIKNIILKIFDENLKQYGYRRIYNEIKQLNLGVSEHTVRKYMKKYNIIAEYVKKNAQKNENKNQ